MAEMETSGGDGARLKDQPNRKMARAGGRGITPARENVVLVRALERNL